MLTEAARNGHLRAGSCILEATSGNMGIALAGIAKELGYQCKIVMPENVSSQRKKLIRNFHAELILTDGSLGMKGAINKAKEILKDSKNTFYCDQFNNICSVDAHILTTAPEITHKLREKTDVIIAGIGTGATVRGLYEYFKEINFAIEIIGILPDKHPHKIEGIGAGFVPPFLTDISLDQIITVSDSEALKEQSSIFLSESLFVGKSSGAVIAGLKKLLKNNKYCRKNIVMIFPDGGDRYI